MIALDRGHICPKCKQALLASDHLPKRCKICGSRPDQPCRGSFTGNPLKTGRHRDDLRPSSMDDLPAPCANCYRVLAGDPLDPPRKGALAPSREGWGT